MNSHQYACNTLERFLQNSKVNASEFSVVHDSNDVVIQAVIFKGLNS